MIKSIKNIFQLLLKGIVAAAAGIAGLITGGIIAGMLPVSQAELPAGTDPNVILAGFFLCWIITSNLLGQISQRIKLSFSMRMLFIFLLLYFIESFLNILEANFFMLNFPVISQAVSSLFPALFIALTVCFLWPVDTSNTPAKERIKNYFKQHKFTGWLWRIITAWLGFTVIYFAMGMIVSPVVVPYYLDPANGLNLIIPPTATIILLQLLRGGITLLIFMPFIIFWEKNRNSFFLWLSLASITMVPLTGMIGAFFWPLELRIAHGLELSADCILLILVYSKLLCIKKKSTLKS